jgi:hypothetical protein
MGRYWLLFLFSLFTLSGQEVPKRTDQQDIQELITQLGSRDYEVRTRATQQLLRLGEKVAPFLRKVLKDPSTIAEVRDRAKRILIEVTVVQPLKDKLGQRLLEKLPELIDYFSKEDGDGLCDYLASLGREITNRQLRVIAPFVFRLRSQPESKQRFIQLLIDRGIKRSVKHWVHFLQDKDSGLRETVLRGLRRFGVQRVKKEIIPILEHDDPQIKGAAALALVGNILKDEEELILPLLDEEHPYPRVVAIYVLTASKHRRLYRKIRTKRVTGVRGGRLSKVLRQIKRVSRIKIQIDPDVSKEIKKQNVSVGWANTSVAEKLWEILPQVDHKIAYYLERNRILVLPIEQAVQRVKKEWGQQGQ